MARMDRAPLLCIHIAQDKAYSVASFGGLPTSDWWRLLESEPALLHGIVKTERLIIFGGGVPLVIGGRTVGAVGVSGGSAEQDVQIAEAGAAVLG
jgi:glc operon protein GlcG